MSKRKKKMKKNVETKALPVTTTVTTTSEYEPKFNITLPTTKAPPKLPGFSHDYTLMDKILTADEEYFLKYGKYHEPVKGHPYVFQDNGADILAIAHVDTVQMNLYSRRLFLPTGHRIILANGADDRIGVYTLVHLLPQFGLKYDLLLTTDEEIGASTAEYFKPPRQYNWAFEFDRRGTDLALYHYIGDSKWTDALEDVFGEKSASYGSFTDISYLDANCCAVNVGAGYHDAHMYSSYVYLHELEEMVSKFVQFYNTHKDTKFPFISTFKKRSHLDGEYYGYANLDGDDRYWDRFPAKRSDNRTYHYYCQAYLGGGIYCYRSLVTEEERRAGVCNECAEMYSQLGLTYEDFPAPKAKSVTLFSSTLQKMISWTRGRLSYYSIGDESSTQAVYEATGISLIGNLKYRGQWLEKNDRLSTVINVERDIDARTHDEKEII